MKVDEMWIMGSSGGQGWMGYMIGGAGQSIDEVLKGWMQVHGGVDVGFLRHSSMGK